MSYHMDENGNYKRSVRCGHCYETGHNKSSCKIKKQSHLDQIAGYEQQLAEDKFTDDWERNYAKRNLERHKAELNKAANRGKNRKCSYCKDEGHTRRTCSFRKGDMNSYAAKCVEAREKFVENMTEVGFGIGALGYRTDSWGDSKVLAIVESVFWGSFNHNVAVDSPNQYSEIVRARTFESTEHYPAGRVYGCLLPSSVSNINNQEVSPRFERRCFDIVSPVVPSPPEDFLTIESALRAAKESEEFDDSRPYDYHGIVYDE